LEARKNSPDEPKDSKKKLKTKQYFFWMKIMMTSEHIRRGKRRKKLAK